MAHTEQTEQQAFPLADAAARLELTSDALRMRLKRGKIQGFKRGRRVFVYLPVNANKSDDRRAVSSEQRPSHETSESEQAADSKRTKTMPPPQADFSTAQTWPVVVEFQKVELNRVLKENERLNRRLDQLFGEIGHLREIQQREQVLRQQDQLLHQQLQSALDRLTGGRLTGGQLAGRSSLPQAAAADQTPPQTRPQEVRTQTPLRTAPGQNAAPELDQEPTSSQMAPERETKENDTEELADILRQVGRSLRDQDELGPLRPAPAPNAPPAMPRQERATPREKAERRGPGLSSSPLPVSPPAPPLVSPPAPPLVSPPAPPLVSPPAPPLVPPLAPPSLSRRLAQTNTEEMLGDEQSSLAEILGRMGPSAEDRRNAARIMKRLFRNRGGSRRRDP